MNNLLSLLPVPGAVLALVAGAVLPLRALPEDPAAVLGTASGGQAFRVLDLLGQADLDGVVFKPGADLRDADFTGKTLRGAVLRATDCSRARFHQVDLRSTDLRGATCAGADFMGALLDPGTAERLRAEGADLSLARVLGPGSGLPPAGSYAAPAASGHRGPSQVPQGFINTAYSNPGGWIHTKRDDGSWGRVDTKGGPGGRAGHPRTARKAQAKLTWEGYFALLKAYTAEHGTSQVLQRFVTKKGVRLGSWVGRQRGARKNKSKDMTPERIRALEKLPGWTWDASPKSSNLTWEDHFALLKAYTAEHGASRAPVGFMTKGGVRLGAWVSSQRTAWKKGSPALTPERIQALEGLTGWVWEASAGRPPERLARTSAGPGQPDPPGVLPMALAPAEAEPDSDAPMVKQEDAPRPPVCDEDILAEIRRLTSNVLPGVQAENCVELAEGIVRFLVTGEPTSAPAPLDEDPMDRFAEEVRTVTREVTVKQEPGRLRMRKLTWREIDSVDASRSQGHLAMGLEPPGRGFIETARGLAEVFDVEARHAEPSRIDASRLRAYIEAQLTGEAGAGIDRVIAVGCSSRAGKYADDSGHMLVLYGYLDAGQDKHVRFIDAEDKDPITDDLALEVLNTAGQRILPDTFAPSFDVFIVKRENSRLPRPARAARDSGAPSSASASGANQRQPKRKLGEPEVAGAAAASAEPSPQTGTSQSPRPKRQRSLPA